MSDDDFTTSGGLTADHPIPRGLPLYVAPTDANDVNTIRVPLAPIACASKTRYQPCDDCVSEFACPVRLVMVEAQRALSQVLDNCSLARMRQLGRSGVIDALCEAPPPQSPPRLAMVKN